MGKTTMAFLTGDEVEVSSDEEGFRGAWFEATVHRTMPRVRRYTVVYTSLLADGKNVKPLRETVEWCHVRPPPPPPSRDAAGFDIGQAVDAYHNDGWWAGFVSEMKAEKRRYVVRFPDSNEEIEFELSQLRDHHDWVDGKWVNPLLLKKKWVKPQDTKIKTELQVEFCKGALVEVSSDEEGFRGAWYTATVVEQIGDKRFLVEYHNLKTDDERELLRETVDFLHIRPAPPITKVSKFKLLEEVDALYQDGWWVGVVSKVQHDARYVVYFRQTKEEMEFLHNGLRLHHDWINGRWARASQALGL